MPGQAYVALSRSPSSELVSLTAFDPGCFSTMAGIEWALNELYIQQSEAKPPTTRGNADILAEMVLRPPHPPEHYRELQRVLQRPDWLVYAKDAAEWQDLPDDFDEQPKRIKCARCGQLVDSTILAQRQHNQRCTGKARRKRQSAGSTTPATTKSTRRKDSSAAATIPSASSRVPSKASTDLVVIPAGRRWTCHALEFGTALASSPEWYNPTRSDAVAQNRTQNRCIVRFPRGSAPPGRPEHRARRLQHRVFPHSGQSARAGDRQFHLSYHRGLSRLLPSRARHRDHRRHERGCSAPRPRVSCCCSPTAPSADIGSQADATELEAGFYAIVFILPRFRSPFARQPQKSARRQPYH